MSKHVDCLVLFYEKQLLASLPILTLWFVGLRQQEKSFKCTQKLGKGCNIKLQIILFILRWQTEPDVVERAETNLKYGLYSEAYELWDKKTNPFHLWRYFFPLLWNWETELDDRCIFNLECSSVWHDMECFLSFFFLLFFISFFSVDASLLRFSFLPFLFLLRKHTSCHYLTLSAQRMKEWTGVTQNGAVFVTMQNSKCFY